MKTKNTNSTILLVKGLYLFRSGLKSFMKEIPNYNYQFHEITKVKDALSFIRKKEVDMVLFDLDLMTINDYELFASLAEFDKRPKIILYSEFFQSISYRKYFKDLSIEGYFLKSSTKDEIVRGLTIVIEGGCFFCDELVKIIKNSDLNAWKLTVREDEVLSPKEEQVLLNICDQKTNAEIAEILQMSEYTVKNHRKSIKKKLNIPNTVGLVAYAFREGLIPLPSKYG